MKPVFPEEKQKVIRIGIQAVSVLGLLFTIVFFLGCARRGILTDAEAMEAFLAGAGGCAGLLFILLQIVQVVVPILPGGISLLAGVLFFGPVLGFVYNYIGICIGSVLIFLLARRYGRPLMFAMFSRKTIEKYDAWTKTRDRFTKLFAAAIFFPMAPDDFLCFLAGTTTMSLSVFSGIILLGKPLSIAAYSVGLYFFYDKVMALFSH